MRRYDKRQTAMTFALRVAREHGQEVDRATAGWVIWNRTGFPSFWAGEPWSTFDEQLSDYFAGRYYCGRCRRTMASDDGELNLCAGCDAGMTGYCVECGGYFVDGDDVRARGWGSVHRECERTAEAHEATWEEALEGI